MAYYTEKKWVPSEAQWELLERLSAEIAAEKSQGFFASEFTMFDAGKLSRILAAINPDRDRSYFDELKTPEAREELMGDVKRILDHLPAKRLELQKKDLVIKEFSVFRAVYVAVKEARQEVTPERIIKYIAPTGGGKTWLRMYLQAKAKNDWHFNFVESRSTWRPTSRDNRERAKRVLLTDLCDAMQLRLGDERSSGCADQLENAILKHCLAAQRILFVDEAEFFSAYALNFFKYLLNRSRLVLVIACTPRAHGKWNQYYPDEADQIARRTRAVVQVSKISTGDVELMFPENQFADGNIMGDSKFPKSATEYLAEEASLFGHFSFLNRVGKILENCPGAGRKEIENAVDKALTQMHRQRTKPKT